MKKIMTMFLVVAISSIMTSCEKDGGNLPNISFKTGGSYISTNVTRNQGASLTFGIDASKAEKRDVLKKFNISRAVNGGASTTVFSKDLSGGEEDNYSYDYTVVADSVAGQTNVYTFTITNRDGLTNQVTSSVTVQ